MGGFGWLLAVAAFAVSMSFTPGPNNAMLAASGANFGFVRTFPHMMGVTVGFPAMVMCMALGAGEVLRAAPIIEVVARWAGAGYLLWLAVKIATTRAAPAGVPSTARPLTFLQAALFQWINPKAWVIALGGVATFTTPDGVVAQSLALAAIFFVASFGSTVFWAATGVGAGRLLRSPRQLRAFNVGLSGLLVASLVPLVRGR